MYTVVERQVEKNAVKRNPFQSKSEYSETGLFKTQKQVSRLKLRIVINGNRNPTRNNSTVCR
jgi:hypothetical protein